MARNKHGDRALGVESIIYSVMDALETKDFDNTQVVLKMICDDHHNTAIVKKELESTKNAKVEVDEKLKKSEELRKGSIPTNNELRIDFDNSKQALRKEIGELKKSLDKEK